MGFILKIKFWHMLCDSLRRPSRTSYGFKHNRWESLLQSAVIGYLGVKQSLITRASWPIHEYDFVIYMWLWIMRCVKPPLILAHLCFHCADTWCTVSVTCWWSSWSPSPQTSPSVGLSSTACPTTVRGRRIRCRHQVADLCHGWRWPEPDWSQTAHWTNQNCQETDLQPRLSTAFMQTISNNGWRWLCWLYTNDEARVLTADCGRVPKPFPTSSC